MCFIVHIIISFNAALCDKHTILSELFGFAATAIYHQKLNLRTLANYALAFYFVFIYLLPMWKNNLLHARLG